MTAIETTGYSIIFNDEIYTYLNGLNEQGYSKLFILADTNTSALCLPHFMSGMAIDIPVEIIEIDAGEESKSVDTCIEVWHVLTDLGADRKSLLINLGGGVVTDLGGFVASVFKRGIDFINVPTSLLAMVDASVGGKTGVDLGILKNQLGVISNPKAVLIHTGFLETLPQPDMRSGLAEMLKHGLIADRGYWNNFTDLNTLNTDDLDALIYQSVEIKNSIVIQDPTEKGLRKILNFGHTLGHAIESHFLQDDAKKTLLHGEAIAIGMILEAYLSWQKQLIAESDYIEIKSVITAIFERVSFSEKDIQDIIELLLHDKKNENGKVNFVLLESIGRATIDHNAENSLILKAFEDYQK